MRDHSTPMFATANALDQLTVRLLLLDQPEQTLQADVIKDLMAEHGSLRGRGPSASLQLLASAAITYRRHFTMDDSWQRAGANVSSGLIAWQKSATGDLVIDRVCGRGLSSFPGVDTVPLTTETLLRVCDLTNPHQSVTYVGKTRGWAPSPDPKAPKTTLEKLA